MKYSYLRKIDSWNTKLTYIQIVDLLSKPTAFTVQFQNDNWQKKAATEPTYSIIYLQGCKLADWIFRIY